MRRGEHLVNEFLFTLEYPHDLGNLDTPIAVYELVYAVLDIDNESVKHNLSPLCDGLKVPLL